MRVPLFLFDPVIQMILPPLPTLFWGFEMFSISLEKYLFGNLVPIRILNVSNLDNKLFTVNRTWEFNLIIMSNRFVFYFFGLRWIDTSETKCLCWKTSQIIAPNVIRPEIFEKHTIFWWLSFRYFKRANKNQTNSFLSF